MTTHQLTGFLAALAVACALAALVLLAIVAMRSGEPHLAAVIPVFMIFLGAGTRLRTSRRST